VGEESALNETLGVTYDITGLKSHVDRDEMARRPAGIWRYHEFLPVADPTLRIDLGAGGTRLARLTRLGEDEVGQKLFMKIEGSNPTGSFKDRPIGVAASVALEHGARGLACLTSGNIGSAMAAVAAKAGVPALVFLLGSAGSRVPQLALSPFNRLPCEPISASPRAASLVLALACRGQYRRSAAT